MRFYAVRMGAYVEFRAANCPPRARVSTLTRMVKTIERMLVYIDTPPYYTYVDKPVTAKITLKTVCYIGGRVLGTAKLTRFRRCPGTPRFGKHGVCEVSKDLKTRVLHV